MPKPSQEETDFAPSYILVFNKDGELQYTLGQRGTPDLPFYYIPASLCVSLYGLKLSIMKEDAMEKCSGGLLRDMSGRKSGLTGWPLASEKQLFPEDLEISPAHRHKTSGFCLGIGRQIFTEDDLIHQVEIDEDLLVAPNEFRFVFQDLEGKVRI